MDRFWSKVDRSPGHGPNGDCWPWTGGRYPKGYGRFWKDGRYVTASREAWERENGPMPEGQRACHSCDWPPCCRPDHIFAGTDKANTHDSISKGRFKPVTPLRPKTHCPKGHAYTPENSIIKPGKRGKACRTCRREADRDRKRRRRARERAA